jgi:hypothetical protein
MPKRGLNLTAELAPGDVSSLAEGKAILAEIQTRMVTAQIERHGQTRRCRGWGENSRRTGIHANRYKIWYMELAEGFEPPTL